MKASRKQLRLKHYDYTESGVYFVTACSRNRECLFGDIVGATGRSPLHDTIKPGLRSRSLGAFMAGFKSSTTKQINIIRATPGIPVWQRNYYEHVIRTDDELNKTREYIINNPMQWELDEENPNVRPVDDSKRLY
jgi:putative transposase